MPLSQPLSILLSSELKSSYPRLSHPFFIWLYHIPQQPVINCHKQTNENSFKMRERKTTSFVFYDQTMVIVIIALSQRAHSFIHSHIWLDILLTLLPQKLADLFVFRVTRPDKLFWFAACEVLSTEFRCIEFYVCVIRNRFLSII